MNGKHKTALSLALMVALAGCSDPAAKNTRVDAVHARTPIRIDQNPLPHVEGFNVTDLDRARNACTDLFGYVNGQWLASNPIPPDRSSWGPVQIFVERALAIQHQIAEQASADNGARGVERIVGDFYATGMDRASVDAQGFAPLADQLAEISRLQNAADVVAYLRTSAARGDLSLFQLYSDADFKDPSMTIAYAVQGGLGLPDRGYYLDTDKRPVLDAYRAHVAKVLELSGTNTAAAELQANAVVDFETRLAKASLSSEAMASDMSVYYHPISPAAADALTPHFSWSEFFQSQGVAVPKMFSLGMPQFHQEVDRMLRDAPVAAWQSYLRFHLVDSASPYLSQPFVTENFDFYKKTLSGQKELKADWKRVLETIGDRAGEAMGQLYVDVAFSPRSKAEMLALVENLRTAFKARIEKLDWMSAQTRQKALEKLAAMTPNIGYPDKWRDWSGLETSRSSYFANVAAANAFNHRWEMAKIGKPVDRSEWQTTPQTVNAFYNALRNELVFPAAILQPPAFDPDADPVTNYAAIGAIIGHEMTHGFDGQGSRFGSNGRFEVWWTDADAKTFAARSAKLVDQFNAYEAFPGVHVNGTLTLNENIADLGGIHIAYDAMKVATAGMADPKVDGLSRDQRFFLTFAADWRSQLAPQLQKVYFATDPHAPDRFRAIASPSNMPAFGAAFECKPGDRMVRSGNGTVSIW